MAISSKAWACILVLSLAGTTGCADKEPDDATPEEQPVTSSMPRQELERIVGAGVSVTALGQEFEISARNTWGTENGTWWLDVSDARLVSADENSTSGLGFGPTQGRITLYMRDFDLWRFVVLCKGHVSNPDRQLAWGASLAAVGDPPQAMIEDANSDTSLFITRAIDGSVAQPFIAIETIGTGVGDWEVASCRVIPFK